MTSRLEMLKLMYLQKTIVGRPHQENMKKMEIEPKKKKLSAMSLTHVEILRIWLIDDINRKYLSQEPKLDN